MFCCSNAVDPDELLQGDARRMLTVIPLPCSGRLDILYLTKVFETGADGVAIVMCKQGDCQYLEGNLRAKKRAAAVDSILEEIGIAGRVGIIQLGDGGVPQVLREVDEFCNKIKVQGALRPEPAAR